MKKLSKKLIAFMLIAAMVLTVGNLPTNANAAAKLKLSATKVTVKVGNSKKVTVKNSPSGAKVTWSSNNKKIAKVSNGKITGVKKGSTKVIAKVTYKKNKKKVTDKLTVAVTVKAASTATATPAPTQFTVKSDDTSNIGDARTVTIAGGTSSSMTVYDNGEMRTDVSTQDLIANEMGEGINLGNTMEATKALGEKDTFTEATDFEQAWGAPVTTQKYIDAVHSYGFNTIRIPVAWSSMVSNDGTYTINEKMLGRVEEIVNYALNDGMYVIINDHWDYGWWGQFGSSDTTVTANAWARYESYWNQISTRFKDYSDHLIFEGANEELGDRLNDTINSDGYSVDEGTAGSTSGSLTTVDQRYELANKINQKFVDIVRASGGNNEYRHLLIAGYNTDITKTCSDRFVMPTDTDANGTTKLSVSVHYYTPWDFCGDSMSGADYTEADKEATISNFDKLSKFTEAGYGVIVGEFGVCNPKQDGVTDWLGDVMQIAGERGCVPVLWDTPNMYFDRNSNKMLYKDVAEMYNAITGATGDTNLDASTGAPTGVITTVDVDESATPVWSWVGQWAKNDANNIGLDGNKVTSTDVSKFVETTSCTDSSQITFNDWGYQTFLSLDWSSIKKPCIYVTFADNTEEVVGDLTLSTTNVIGTSGTDEQSYAYSTWIGKGVIPSNDMIKSLQGSTNTTLYLTFGAAPKVTGIYVYDMGN